MIYITALLSFLVAQQEFDHSSTPTWNTPAQIASRIDAINREHDAVSVSNVGFSSNGQPISCLEIAFPGETPIESRAAILVVAGVDGSHTFGSTVALDVIEDLLSRDASDTVELFESHKVYLIPQLNPDLAHHFFAEIKEERTKNTQPTDDDHDGLIDEDGAEDLNGDGLITMMRVRDLENATHIENPDEPRLHISPDAYEGQSAAFVLYTEGIDDDRDGEYNEDSLGGVDLNKNFMHGYKIHGDGAGPWQLSEPETRALVDFALKHQNIAAVVVYGKHDTLTKPFPESGRDSAGAPKQLDAGDVELYKKVNERFVELTDLSNTSQPNWDGSFVAWAYAQYGVPAFSTPLWSRADEVEESNSNAQSNKSETSEPNNCARQDCRSRGDLDRGALRAEFDADGDGELDEDERSAFREHMREKFGGQGQGGPPRQRGGTTSNRMTANNDSSSEGSQLTPSGIGDISQETIDELFAAAEAAGYPVTDEMIAQITPEQIEQYAQMSGIQIRRVQKKSSSSSSYSDEEAWLAYNDDIRGGDGFVEWKEFEHPQLGIVEIGGWVPYFKSVPPIESLTKITNEQSDFLIDLASKLPDVTLEPPTIKKLGTNLWEVKVAVRNDGWLPTGTAMAKKNKRARPYIVRLDVPNDSIVSGRKVNRIWALSGGGTREWFTWIINGAKNSSIDITLFSEKYGTTTTTHTLQNTIGGGS